MRAWHASLGRFTAAVELAKPELLTGNVLIDNTGDQPTIQLFQASSLSPIPRRRFDQLFAMRPRWQLEDLQPFVEYVDALATAAFACRLCSCTVV